MCVFKWLLPCEGVVVVCVCSSGCCGVKEWCEGVVVESRDGVAASRGKSFRQYVSVHAWMVAACREGGDFPLRRTLL